MALAKVLPQEVPMAHIRQGYICPSIDFDEDSYTGFSTDDAARHWAEVVAQSGYKPVTVRSAFTGIIQGDAIWFLDEESLDEDRPRWYRVTKLSDPDNGRVRVTLENGRVWMHEKRVLYFVNPREVPFKTREKDKDYWARVNALEEDDNPHYVDVSKREIYQRSIRAHEKYHGQFLVVQRPEPECHYSHANFLLCWRLDGRRTRFLTVLSAHTKMAYAMEAMGEAMCDYVPEDDKNKNRAPDVQKQKVYDWEKELFRHFPELKQTMIDCNCHGYLREVYLRLGENNPPKLEIKASLDRKSYYRSSSHTIALARQWGRTKSIILHEIAHELVDRYYKKGKDHDQVVLSHGPEYVITYMTLLSRIADIPMDLMLSLAQKYKIKVALAQTLQFKSKAA
jgi:hypothetical protein